jgi:fructose-specific phosphotransferase system IIC component
MPIETVYLSLLLISVVATGLSAWSEDFSNGLSLLMLLIAVCCAISAGVTFLLLLGWGGMLGWWAISGDALLLFLLAIGAFRVWPEVIDRTLYQ